MKYKPIGYLNVADSCNVNYVIALHTMHVPLMPVACHARVSEWLMVAVLKTAESYGSEGSNPSTCALSRCSSVGRAPVLGTGGREFESHYLD